MRRRRREDAHRVLVLRNRDHELARMQMQAWLAETRTLAVDVIADDRPALSCSVNAQLMGAAGDGFQREPGKAVAGGQHFPVGDAARPLRDRLLPPAALGV